MQKQLIINAKNELLNTNVKDYQQELSNFLISIPENAKTEDELKVVRQNVKDLTEIQDKIKEAQDKLFSGELEEIKNILSSMANDVDNKKSILNKTIRDFRKNLLQDIKKQAFEKIKKIQGLILLNVNVDSLIDNALKNKKNVDSMIKELDNLFFELTQETIKRIDIVNYFDSQYIKYESLILKSDYNKFVRDLVVDGFDIKQITTQIDNKIEQIKLHQHNQELQRQHLQQQQEIKKELNAEFEKQNKNEETFLKQSFKAEPVKETYPDLMNLRDLIKYFAKDLKSRHPDASDLINDVVYTINKLGVYLKNK